MVKKASVTYKTGIFPDHCLFNVLKHTSFFYCIPINIGL